MTYPYAVKFNGKWYRPNENVPDGTTETAAAIDDVESANLTVDTQVKEVQPETVVEDEPKKRGRRRKEN